MKYAPLIAVLLVWNALHGNNIQVTAPTLVDDNSTAGHVDVRFNISWQNSWRTSSAPNNWDAAWIFIKYKNANTGLWRHARLHGDAGHTSGTGTAATIATGLLNPGTAFNAASNWGVGTFLFRSGNGTGTFSQQGMQLRWNYAQNGITYADIAEVRVFTIEMVYVPPGNFHVGSGDSYANFQFCQYPNANTPYQITSEGAIAVGPTSGNLSYVHGTGFYIYSYGGDAEGPIPAAFPKGYAGFYCMKHEVAQRDYVDFLNTLTRVQQSNRIWRYMTFGDTDLSEGITSVTKRYVMGGGNNNGTNNPNSPTGLRNGIRCDAVIPASGPINFYCDLNGNGVGNEATDGEGVACAFLPWGHLGAYLDWCGLRPMTELEYEKACRGPQTPVLNEYAWGSTSITAVTSASNVGANNEANATSGANCVYGSYFNGSNYKGPMRVGVFATGSTTRQQAGAGYYGALDLSGNLWEQTVTVGTPPGRSFTGTHGDGNLDPSGGFDTSTWPPNSFGQYGTGIGSRGGDQSLGEPPARISDRVYSTGVATNTNGGRGVRSLP